MTNNTTEKNTVVETSRLKLEKLGTVLISKGNIEWLPSGDSVNKYRVSWGAFSNSMEN
ncbi:hypothetical protein [Pectobacterium sp. 21LCBS03]|uniref:hypothetical protein n=1 Tax=unclassified Pectobacterium TaxID=2627739 RepID=UPI00200EB1CB|nr:hypothetical protein [Pectobacterium sp. 21LCBS03]UPY96961.1 hypothetical protein MYB54_09830 [Pectobacterium sp. 21LCBS03]